MNGIVGKNGVGKTNILDSIYFLAFTKSAIASNDRNGINHQASFASIFGQFDDFSVGLKLEKNAPKMIKYNQLPVEKISQHIGNIPLVIVLPDDTSLIKEGSEDRRKFFDGALCQLDSSYLESLMLYNRTLKQRNSLLKNSNGKPNWSLLDTYNDTLIPLAINISEKRKELINRFDPYLQKNYFDLHGGKEQPKMVFQSHVDHLFERTLKDSMQKDMVMQRTLKGSHKDDVVFYLNNEPIKKFGSQGQQKTFIISLKFALYDFIKEEKKKSPLLLLDDIFDKLDDNRIELLIQLLTDNKRFGQVFITDARSERSKSLLGYNGIETNLIELA